MHQSEPRVGNSLSKARNATSFQVAFWNPDKYGNTSADIMYISYIYVSCLLADHIVPEDFACFFDIWRPPMYSLFLWTFLRLYIHPRKLNWTPKNDGFGKGDSLKIWPFLVSMLDFWSIDIIYTCKASWSQVSVPGRSGRSIFALIMNQFCEVWNSNLYTSPNFNRSGRKLSHSNMSQGENNKSHTIASRKKTKKEDLIFD